jgi:hypothetical protein
MWPREREGRHDLVFDLRNSGYGVRSWFDALTTNETDVSLSSG